MAYTIADITHRRWGKTKGEGPKLKDFLPEWLLPPKEEQQKQLEKVQTVEEQFKTMMQIAVMTQTNKELSPQDIEKIRGTRRPTLLKDKE